MTVSLIYSYKDEENTAVNKQTGELKNGMGLPFMGHTDVNTANHFTLKAVYKEVDPIPIFFNPNNGSGSITILLIPRNGQTTLNTNDVMIETGITENRTVVAAYDLGTYKNDLPILNLNEEYDYL